MTRYLARVVDLLNSLSDRLTPGEYAEVDHLIQHGEPAEGMLTLAWIIANRDIKVSAPTVTALRDLTAGLVPEEYLPPGLDNQIEDHVTSTDAD